MEGDGVQANRAVRFKTAYYLMEEPIKENKE